MPIAGLHCAACHGYRSIDSSRLSLLPTDIQPVCRGFQTLLNRSPPPSLMRSYRPSRTSHGAALGGSQVIPWGLRLACWLRLQDVLVLCTSPPGGSLRFSAGQDSKTPRLLPAIFITTGLAGVPPATCITLCNTPLRCTFRFELSAPVEGSPSPWRSRHSRLRPWPITGPSAAIRAASVRPFRAAPRRGFTRSPMGRNWGAFPPPVRVLVAQSQVLEEWGRRRHFSRQRPVACRTSSITNMRLPLSRFPWRGKHWTLPGPAVAQLTGWQPALCPKGCGRLRPVVQSTRATTV